MNDPADPTEWTAAPSLKEKNVVQRNVMALLDELAPERVLKRSDPAQLAIEQHRTPAGCVLQAPNAALSVSWFTDAKSDDPFGELHVVVWRGVVTRRGAPRVKASAKQVRELVLYPVTHAADGRVWRTADGTDYDTTTLAALCLAMLELQIAE
jgi:hypothetical protein